MVSSFNLEIKLCILKILKIINYFFFSLLDSSSSSQKKNSKQKLSAEDLLEHNAPHHWYDFDDSRITPIYASSISKQFEGKESAYMLFYRRRATNTATSQVATNKDQLYARVPEWLRSEVATENRKLHELRLDQEKKQYSISVDCFLESDFYTEKRVLCLRPNCETKAFALALDKRSTCVGQLKELLVQVCTSINDDTLRSRDEGFARDMKERESFCLNLLFDEAADFHWLLAQRVDTSVGGSSGRFNYFVKARLDNEVENVYELMSRCNKAHKCILILSKYADIWNVGDEYEPVRIVAKFYDSSFCVQEVSFTFVKCTSIREVKEEISQLLLAELNTRTGIGM